MLTKRQETVYSFGHYMRRYANEAKSKGVIVILCTPVPGNNFDECGKIKRPIPFYPDWTKEIASETGASYINLHELTASVYEKSGTKEHHLKAREISFYEGCFPFVGYTHRI
jgi:rhamnogalacturonan acetylesterase